MKVKTGELKTHFSEYLRELQRTREPLEVCVRDRTVAYLVSADRVGGHAAHMDLRDRLAGVGVTLCNSAPPLEKPALLAPCDAGDDRTDIDTVQELRSGRAW